VPFGVAKNTRSQAASRSGNPLASIDHENQDAQFPLHDLSQPRRRRIVKAELGDEPLAGQHGVLETRMAGKAQRSTHERGLTTDLRRQGTKRRDPATGVAFVLAELVGPDTCLPPREAALADEPKRIGEVVESDLQLLQRKHQFVGRNAARAGLDGRDRLPVLETEQPSKIVLGKLALVAQRLEPLADKLCRHGDLRR